MASQVGGPPSVDQILALLSESEPEPGEDPHLSTLAHGLQCAAILRAIRPDDVELQVAGLLHDVGHRWTPSRPERHGVVGAALLRGVFGDRVADLVELHVDAKRYLVAVEPEYRQQLSAGSASTLIAQGEALDARQVEVFRERRHWADAVKLRRADEGAKVPGRQVPGLKHWVPVVHELARAHRGSGVSPA